LSGEHKTVVFDIGELNQHQRGDLPMEIVKDFFNTLVNRSRHELVICIKLPVGIFLGLDGEIQQKILVINDPDFFLDFIEHNMGIERRYIDTDKLRSVFTIDANGNDTEAEVQQPVEPNGDHQEGEETMIRFENTVFNMDDDFASGVFRNLPQGSNIREVFRNADPFPWQGQGPGSTTTGRPTSRVDLVRDRRGTNNNNSGERDSSNNNNNDSNRLVFYNSPGGEEFRRNRATYFDRATVTLSNILRGRPIDATPVPAPAPRTSVGVINRRSISTLAVRRHEEETNARNAVLLSVIDDKAKKAMELRNEDDDMEAMFVSADDNSCMICLSRHVTAMLLPCLHYKFCKECITEWVKKTPKCPECRTEDVTIVQPRGRFDAQDEHRKRKGNPEHLEKLAGKLEREAVALREKASNIRENKKNEQDSDGEKEKKEKSESSGGGGLEEGSNNNVTVIDTNIPVSTLLRPVLFPPPPRPKRERSASAPKVKKERKKRNTNNSSNKKKKSGPKK